MRGSLSFAHPIAFGLLALLLLRYLPRRRPPSYLAFNRSPGGRLPPPPWHRHLPAWCLTAYMAGLIGLIAEPVGTTEVSYTVQEARKILLLIDASASMEGEPIRAAKAVAAAFIRQRPASDSIGVVLFSDVASGGIITRNHRGLIKELHRQEGIGISGTQLGVGLYKCLTSFIEDEVETALWQNRTLTTTQRQQRFQHLQDEMARLGRHLLHKKRDAFILHLAEIPDPHQLGKGKVLIILSDARVHVQDAAQEIIEQQQVLRLYETMGFARLYFISVDTLPTQLAAFFHRHPSWRFLRIRSLTDRDQLAQAYAEIDQWEQTQSYLEARLVPQALYFYGWPVLLLLPLALMLRVFTPFRSLV